MGFEVSGFDELRDELNQLHENAKELEKTNSVSFNDLFNSSFMQEHTKFSDIDELFKSGNFIVKSEEDFEAIPEEKLDVYINEVTNFSSWQDMLDEAVKEFTIRKLGL